MPKGVVEPAEVRFWRFVAQSDDCYEWIGSRDAKGYGKFKAIAGLSAVRAHRFVWELANGPIPEGLVVCHHCDNPSCVRQDHLFLGTSADNTQDAIAKGRWGPEIVAKGCEASRAKLSAEQVRLIRIWIDEGISHREAARRVGLHASNITRLVNRKTYTDVLP